MFRESGLTGDVELDPETCPLLATSAITHLLEHVLLDILIIIEMSLHNARNERVVGIEHLGAVRRVGIGAGQMTGSDRLHKKVVPLDVFGRIIGLVVILGIVEVGESGENPAAALPVL